MKAAIVPSKRFCFSVRFTDIVSGAKIVIIIISRKNLTDSNYKYERDK
jgi:hypothetical protein